MSSALSLNESLNFGVFSDAFDEHVFETGEEAVLGSKVIRYEYYTLLSSLNYFRFRLMSEVINMSILRTFFVNTQKTSELQFQPMSSLLLNTIRNEVISPRFQVFKMFWLPMAESTKVTDEKGLMFKTLQTAWNTLSDELVFQMAPGLLEKLITADVIAKNFSFKIYDTLTAVGIVSKNFYSKVIEEIMLSMTLTRDIFSWILEDLVVRETTSFVASFFRTFNESVALQSTAEAIKFFIVRCYAKILLGKRKVQVLFRRFLR